MRWLFVAFVALHGVIHFMGFAKAFGFAELPQLGEPITGIAGMAWAAAGVLVLATAVLVAVSSRNWVFVGVVAALLSQAVIVSAWSDAKFGTIANVVILVAIVMTSLSHATWSSMHTA